MTQEYELNESQLNQLLDACKPTVCIKVGSYAAPTPQANANRAWAALGTELGFQPMTVRPVAGKPTNFFTAEPVDADAAAERELAKEDADNKATVAREGSL